MANIDDTAPADNSLISQYPANERTSRTQIKAFITGEHDETSERHKFVVGTTSARDLITNWQTGSVFFNTDVVTGKKVLQVWDGAAWITTDTELLDVSNEWTKAQHGAYTVLTSGATVASDWATSNFFSLTLGINATLSDPSNIPAATKAGTWVYEIKQDGTGSRTLAYGSKFKFSLGVAPTLTTAAGSIDYLYCTLRNDGNIQASFIRDSK